MIPGMGCCFAVGEFCAQPHFHCKGWPQLSEAASDQRHCGHSPQGLPGLVHVATATGYHFVGHGWWIADDHWSNGCKKLIIMMIISWFIMVVCGLKSDKPTMVFHGCWIMINQPFTNNINQQWWFVMIYNGWLWYWLDLWISPTNGVKVTGV